MIFRTESISAGAVGAPPARIVKVAVKAIVAAWTGLFGKVGRRPTHILPLSDHALRDIGLEHGTPGAPIAYDLLDLVPRGNSFRHRAPR